METKKVDVKFTIDAKDKELVVDHGRRGITTATIIAVPGFSVADISMNDIISGRAKVWVLESKPVDSERKTANYFGVKGIKIETFSTKNKEGFVTINGVIDLPVESRTKVAVNRAVFLSKEDAIKYARILTAIEYERVEELLLGYEEDLKFLRDNLDADRF